MKAVDYLKAKARMTGGCSRRCNPLCCKLASANNGTNKPCTSFEFEHSEQAVEIVEKWAKEHPIKTYLSVLLEKLPNTRLTGKDRVPEDFCPNSVFKIKKDYDYCNTNTCKDCWNREYKEDADV